LPPSIAPIFASPVIQLLRPVPYRGKYRTPRVRFHSSKPPRHPAPATNS